MKSLTILTPSAVWTKCLFRLVDCFIFLVSGVCNCIGCRFEYRSSAGLNGTVSSPNYPGLYPRNTRCTYILNILPQQRVTVTFRHFDVSGIMPKSVLHTCLLSDIR